MTDFADDRNALETIAFGVPPELQGSIARKPTAKAAWDSLKKTHLDVDRVSQARANMPRQEFDTLQFKDAELVDDFGARITDLANQLEVLNTGYMEPEIVR
jgi:4-aminobutyrate aminotransferase-like enzyme